MVHVNVYVKHQEVNLWLLYERSVKNQAGKNSSAAKVLEENQSYGLCVQFRNGYIGMKKVQQRDSQIGISSRKRHNLKKEHMTSKERAHIKN